MMQVTDWQIQDHDIILHLVCDCGERFTGEESDLFLTCPSCGGQQKVKPHPKTCERCPNRYTLRGCPAYISEEHGFRETNVETQEERAITGCSHVVMARMMQQVIIASNRPAAAVESARNEIAEGFSQVAGVMTRLVQESAGAAALGHGNRGRLDDNSDEGDAG